MRTVQLAGGVSFDVRGLTRKELKKFKKDSVDFGSLEFDTSEQVLDDVFAKILTSDQIKQLEDMENKYAMAVWKACMKETFFAPDEEKNS